jgi:hypothetical protein
MCSICTSCGAHKDKLDKPLVEDEGQVYCTPCFYLGEGDRIEGGFGDPDAA